MTAKKPLSERKTGLLIAALGGLAGGPIGLLVSPYVLLLLNNTLKGKNGKQPNRFIPWALIGVIGSPICWLPFLPETKQQRTNNHAEKNISEKRRPEPKIKSPESQLPLPAYKPAALVEYKLISERISSWQSQPNEKRLVDVELVDRVTADNIRKIAGEIISSAGRAYGYTNISFRLPDSRGGWAQADLLLSGELSSSDIGRIRVKFQGLTIEEMAALYQTRTDPVARAMGSVLGTWIYTEVPPGEKIQLIKTDDSLIMKHTSAGGGHTREHEMTSRPTATGMRIVDKENNSFGEYYMINKKGDLEFWSENGNFYTAPKFVSR
ncbi:MAG: hypothetical protein ACKO45_08135 [Cyanobium sp.]